MPIVPDLMLLPFADTGDKQIPPQNDANAFVNFTDGYTVSYEISLSANNPQAKAVERPIMNYLFNALTTNVKAWQQAGRPAWQAAMTGGYGKNSEVLRLSSTNVWIPFRSLIDSNMSDPNTTPASWEYVPFASEAAKNIPMPSGGPNGATAQLVLVATDFNSFLTGTYQFQTDAITVGSPNSPAANGFSGVAGMLECIIWSAGGSNTYGFQRYSDHNGIVYTRSAANGVWASWNLLATYQQVQDALKLALTPAYQLYFWGQF